MNVDSTDFLSAGFFITKRVHRSSYNSPDLLPENLLSASECICTFVPDTWCVAWTGDTPELRWEKAKVFALDPEALARLTDHVTSRFEVSFGWPNVCFSLAAAREIVQGLLTDRKDVVVFELGLHKQFMEAFLKAAEPPPSPPGHAPMGRQGVLEMILKELPLAAGGIPLGFEPLVFYYSLSDSWLCNGLETVFHDRLGLTPNAQGFIASLEEALRGVELLWEGKVAAEPGLWLPWLILDHTRSTGP